MPTSTAFRIRVSYGVSLLFADGLSLDILDVTNQLICVYDYRGISLAISSPASVSTRGPWNDFTTALPHDVSGFGGLARFVSMAVMDRSNTAFEITPLGWSEAPITIAPFNTGWTLGFSGGVDVGVLQQLFPPIPAASARWPHDV